MGLVRQRAQGLRPYRCGYRGAVGGTAEARLRPTIVVMRMVGGADAIYRVPTSKIQNKALEFRIFVGTARYADAVRY